MCGDCLYCLMISMPISRSSRKQSMGHGIISMVRRKENNDRIPSTDSRTSLHQISFISPTPTSKSVIFIPRKKRSGQWSAGS